MNRYLPLASLTLIALSFPSNHKTTYLRLPFQQLQGFSTMVHTGTELFLMTQLKTQLTKLVLSNTVNKISTFTSPFYLKKQVHQLTTLCGTLRLITQGFKTLERLARIYTHPLTDLSMRVLMPRPELRLFTPHLKVKLVSTYAREFSGQGPESSDPTCKNLSDEQSIRLSFSSVLYTSEVFLPHST